MNKEVLIGVIIVVLVVVGLAYYFIFLQKAEEVEIPPVSNIVVFSPQEGDEVGLPLKVQGKARVFEGTVNLRLKEKDGEVLVEDITMAKSPEMGQFGPFEKELLYSQPAKAEGILEVFQISAKDGSEIDKVVIPIRFKTVESLTIKVFFSNSKEDPQGLYCDEVYQTQRRIPKTQAVARAALNELLKGPTITEQNQGFFTSLNPGVKIQSLTIENGVAKVDFDEQLEFRVGGSCRVFAIRAQIIETLKQFPTIDDVIISINGRTEDILQP